MRSAVWILAIFILGSMTFKSPDKTLENLQQAYQKEAYQMKKYEMFSIKAKSEGYTEIADLFHAASTSESVQMKNHQQIIENMGSEVENSEYKEVKTQTTSENLKEAVKEAGTNEAFYQDLVKVANDENLGDAKESFKFAKEAEQQHKQLFEKAASDIENFPDGDYYVSQETGATYKTEKGQSRKAQEQSAQEKYLEAR